METLYKPYVKLLVTKLENASFYNGGLEATI